MVNKLFEFMHETHEGVQDMACDTFIKIAIKCRRQFVQIQVGEVMPFIDELLSSITTTICDLQPQQVQTFYEAVGHMISASTDQQQQERLIERYMQLPNQVTITTTTIIGLDTAGTTALTSQHLLLFSQIFEAP